MDEIILHSEMILMSGLTSLVMNNRVLKPYLVAFPQDLRVLSRLT